MRKRRAVKRDVLVDPVYGSKVITKLTNQIMLDGKKGPAQKIVYKALDMVQERTNENPMDVFNKALENIKPALTFADKHPRLAKIGNFFKGIRDRIIRREKNETENIETKEPVKKEETDEKSFKEYIRQIAEKGMDGVAADEKAARVEAAKIKLEEMRTANRISEAIKYGEDYAKQSDPRTQDDGR